MPSGSSWDGSALRIAGPTTDDGPPRDGGAMAWATGAGDAQLTACIDLGDAAAAGVDLRAGPDADALALRIGLHAGGQVRWRWRHRRAGRPELESTECAWEGSRPWPASRAWLRLERRGARVHAAVSAEGSAWIDLLPDRVLAWSAEACGGAVWAIGGSATASALQWRGGRAPDASASAWSDALDLRVAVVAGADGRPATAFAAIPAGFDAASLRAVVWSTGSKEIEVGDGLLPWIVGEGLLRRPAGLSAWEGSLRIASRRPLHRLLASHGLLRIGGVFAPEALPAALRRLAEATGIPSLADVPVVAVGGSHCGQLAARSAQLWPGRIAAVAANVRWLIGADGPAPPEWQVPHLHAYGTRDDDHAARVAALAPRVRAAGAPWVHLPMWEVGHWPTHADRLIWPWLLAVLERRLPAHGGGRLRDLDLGAGWYGWCDPAPGSVPRIAAVAAWTGDPADAVWLPDEATARIWAACAARSPAARMVLPRDEAPASFCQPPPFHAHHDVVRADLPLRVTAAGPLASDLEVRWLVNGREVEPVSQADPWQAILPPPSPGCCTIHAEGRIAGRPLVAHPVTVLSAAR